jgi:outer membrane receptor protein involved in Fe transport
LRTPAETSAAITAFTAATPGRNLYRFNYETINAGISYQVRPNLHLTLDAANLTNEPQAFYRGVRSQMQNNILNGTTLTFGVNGRF